MVSCDSSPRRFARDKSKILPEAKMRAVLRDIHIADGALKAKHVPDDSTAYYARGYYQAVLDKHNVSVKKYKRSIKYYIHNPDVLNPIYDSINRDLEERKQALDTLSP
jgi:alkyl sulfatase BDS1-like metallo-beta-lactamase superfamily hydrolase